MVTMPEGRPILTAEILAVGSELTTGETRDTNSGELAAALTGEGVRILRTQSVPDDLDIVSGAFADAVQRADMVMSTGGLGPTPDDLTRESIARVIGESPDVDPGLEAWLRGLWARRDMPFPELNLKQAWLVPSATAIPNDNGTAPGWWVDRPGGRVVVALPGPPREMRPMWRDWVLPRLRARGLGRPAATLTLRLTGIGESQLADALGPELLLARNPVVATYARVDAVDVRISAVDETHEDATPPRSAAELVRLAELTIRELVGDHVWATGTTTWREAIAERLAPRGWRVALVEIGTGGSLTALLADGGWLERSEVRSEAPGDLEALAAAARDAAETEVGLAVRAEARGDDTAVSVAVVTPDGARHERRLAFLGGAQGRFRAALSAAAILHAALAAPGGADGR